MLVGGFGYQSYALDKGGILELKQGYQKEVRQMGCQYEVLSPWAEVDPRQLRGISPRVTDMSGKKIGLFANSKQATTPIMAVLEKKMADKFPNSEIIRYTASEQYRTLQMEGKNRSKFEEWVKGVNTVVAAVGD